MMRCSFPNCSEDTELELAFGGGPLTPVCGVHFWVAYLMVEGMNRGQNFEEALAEISGKTISEAMDGLKKL